MHSTEALSNWYASVFLCQSLNADFKTCVAVWALVQDYKFYNAEGARRKGNWSDNVAFKAGALQGYQATHGQLSDFEREETEKRLRIEIIEISDDSESDSDSDGDQQIPMEVDVETSRWATRGEDVSNFLAELKELADSESHGQDETANLPPICQRMDSDRDNVWDINELCADVNHMHGDTDHDSGLSAEEMKIEYEFAWTGM